MFQHKVNRPGGLIRGLHMRRNDSRVGDHIVIKRRGRRHPLLRPRAQRRRFVTQDRFHGLTKIGRMRIYYYQGRSKLRHLFYAWRGEFRLRSDKILQITTLRFSGRRRRKILGRFVFTSLTIRGRMRRHQRVLLANKHFMRRVRGRHKSRRRQKVVPGLVATTKNVFKLHVISGHGNRLSDILIDFGVNRQVMVTLGVRGIGRNRVGAFYFRSSTRNTYRLPLKIRG